MSRSGILGAVAAVTAAAFVVSACGSGDGPAVGTVAVSLHEGAIILSPSVHPAGDITFRVENADLGEVHELVVVRTDLAAAQLPLAEDGSEADENALEVVDEIEDVAPGGGGDLTVRLAAGHYVLLCNLPGHYGAAMYADFEVTP